jgi:hypothetical protein
MEQINLEETGRWRWEAFIPLRLQEEHKNHALILTNTEGLTHRQL